MEPSSRRVEQILENVRRQSYLGIKGDALLAQDLADLKVIARNPNDARAVYCAEGILSLARCAFSDAKNDHPKSSLEAARIIANALLLEPQMQQVLSDKTQMLNIVKFYALLDAEHEFIGGRILFLLTYKTETQFEQALIDKHGLVRFIRSYLWKHATALSDGTFASEPMRLMALVETLKLLYNLASRFWPMMHILSTTTIDLLEIMSKATLPSNPLDPPIIQILNALAILEWPSTLANERGNVLPETSKKLVQILESVTTSTNARQSETVLVSLITVLRRLYELANQEMNRELCSALLPKDEERDKPLGRSDSLPSRLLQLQTSGGLNVLPDAISGLFFDLSDRDASRFVHNIGYGHAAGYLMTHKIPVSDVLRLNAAAPNSSNTINPITGQRLDAEDPVSMPNMTDEEKEREAERLYVLFERLRATGVVDVENPLRTAQQSGRFEELSDSDPD